MVALFVALVAFFTLLQPKTPSSPSLASSEDAISSALIASASKDSDGDGLPDWEEQLRGTDPHNPDTDGDGVSDGQEVAQGRDPLTPGEGKSPSVTSPGSTLDLTARTAPGNGLSNTDALAINLFKNYLSKKQGGQTLTPEDEQAVVNAVAASGNVATKPTVYAAGDVSVTGTSSSTLAAYNRALSAALAPVLSIKEYELLTLQNAISGQDPNGMMTYKHDVALYGESIRALVSMNVPRDALSAHVGLLNALSGMKATLADLETIATDPLVAFVAMSGYEAREAALNQSFRTLGSFMLVNNLKLTLSS